MATNDATSDRAAPQGPLINDPDFLKSLLQLLLQQHLDHEMIEHLQANWHERTPRRKGYRNGYRARSLKTRVGTLELLVPVDRHYFGTFELGPTRTENPQCGYRQETGNNTRSTTLLTAGKIGRGGGQFTLHERFRLAWTSLTNCKNKKAIITITT